jgi:hypothetical protein
MIDTNAKISVSGASINFGSEDYLVDAEAQQRAIDKTNEKSSIYKKDLLMFAEGGLFNHGDKFLPSGDLKSVGGLLNYAQAITHRLMTTRGTMPGDAFFGVPWDLFLGRSYTRSSIVTSNLIQEISDEVGKDRRTQRVVSIKANFIDNNTLEVLVSLLAVGVTLPVDISLNVGVT